MRARRPKLNPLLTATLLGAAFLSAGSASRVLKDPTTERPHIILVMADDQGWGDVGYNGHPFVQTPGLDEMAGESLVFDRFYAAAPVCSPTRASVLTGRHPIRSKVTNHGRYMRPHEETLAEVLSAHGYVTGLFGKFHLGSGQPDSACNPTGAGFDEWTIGLNFFDEDPVLSRQGVAEQRTGLGSTLLMDDALAFLDRHKGGASPTFTVVWFPSPHDPHGESSEGLPTYEGKEHAGYYREISILDAEVSRLRASLRTMGIADNTILWYCSDNGGLVQETSGGRGRKGSIYEGGLRVPALLEWPASDFRGRCSVPASTSDIFPTLLSMVGAERRESHPLDGVDLSDVLAGKEDLRQRPMGFWHGMQNGQATWSDRILRAIQEKQAAKAPLPHNPSRLHKDVFEFLQFEEDMSRGHAAWTDWPWKLHRVDGDRYELYRLDQDPSESSDLSSVPEHAERRERMDRELRSWMSSVVRSLNGGDY